MASGEEGSLVFESIDVAAKASVMYLPRRCVWTLAKELLWCPCYGNEPIVSCRDNKPRRDCSDVFYVSVKGDCSIINVKATVAAFA